MNEVWKDIPAYEGRYQVSDLGRVKSLRRTVRCGTGGRGTRIVPERILRPGRVKSGHLSVVLGHKESGSLVHQLILLAFVGPAPFGMEVLHKNGDPTDNRLENLHYGTRTENILDVYRIGGRWRKLNVAEVSEIKIRLAAGERGSILSKEYGVSQGCISAIKTGRTYSWAT